MIGYPLCKVMSVKIGYLSDEPNRLLIMCKEMGV